VPKTVELPLRPETVADLRVGDEVFLNGPVYAARDAAHARLCEALDDGLELPFEISGQTIYYMGPTPPRPGQVIGAAGPTTSSRMDRYTVRLLEAGLGGCIGKGSRSPEVRAALARWGAVYFGAIGGIGALLSQHITAVTPVAYADLGPEAITRLELSCFPATVIYDAFGGDLFVKGREAYRQHS
jgi:fumarate hydratase subunit beta